MSWNGSGTFNRLYSWVADKAAGINITASRIDADTNDIVASGLDNCLTRDGQGIATAQLPMGGFRHTGVGSGVARTDYAAYGQLQDGVVNWVAAGGTADALTATYVPAVTALVDGQLCFVRATAPNATTTPTYAPSGLTARTITKIGGAAVVAGEWVTNQELALRYNLANTRWELINPVPLVTLAANTFTGLQTMTLGATISGAPLAMTAEPINEAQGADIASASTINLTTATGNLVDVTGTTPITAITLAQGARRRVRFTGALTLTNGASLVLPGGANIPTAAGDFAEFVGYAAGVVRCAAYTRVSGAPVVTGGPGGFINILRNAALDVWQRGTSGTAPSSASTSANTTADGWVAVPTGANCTWAQATGRALTASSLKITGAASVTGLQLHQRIEGSLCNPLASNSVTFQAWVFNNTGGSITPTITVKHATALDNWGASATDVNAQSLQACGNSAWTQVSYTFTASASSGNGLEVTIDFGNNFTTTGKFVQFCESDLRASGSVQPPELRPLPVEMPVCQRYFYSTYGNGVAAASATHNGIAGGPNYYFNTINVGVGFRFPVSMRAAPTISYWDGAGNASKFSIYNALTSTWTDNDAATQQIVNISTTGFVGAGNDNAFFIHYQSTAEL